MLDIIIRGGDVVTPQGVTQCDVAIAGETIAAIAAPDTLPAQSAGKPGQTGGHPRRSARLSSALLAGALAVRRSSQPDRFHYAACSARLGRSPARSARCRSSRYGISGGK